MIWLAFVLMTAGVVLCLVWPLAGPRAGVEAAAADIDFYRSQLAEVEGDVARGAISPPDAETTRTEIARRLLASAGQPAAPSPAAPSRRWRMAAIALVVLGVPAASLALYTRLGHPDEPDIPLAGRTDPNGTDLAAAIPRIEAHLAAHPEDGRGFALIAPIYLRMQRFDDAVRAYSAALASLGEDAQRRASLGQAMVMAADGVVTKDARAAFDQALIDDPKLPEARFFEAVAAEQDGDKAKALDLWRALAADTPRDASWRASVDQHIAGLSGQPATPAPAIGPGAPGAVAIAALPPAQQMQAIQGMVDGLAARLAQNGRDCDGWLRLIRAYKVLGQQDKAQAALADARRGLDGDTASIARIDELGRELGLEG